MIQTVNIDDLQTTWALRANPVLLRYLSGEESEPDDALIRQMTEAMNPDGVWVSPGERPILARAVLDALKETSRDAPG